MMVEHQRAAFQDKLVMKRNCISYTVINQFDIVSCQELLSEKIGTFCTRFGRIINVLFTYTISKTVNFMVF